MFNLNETLSNLQSIMKNKYLICHRLLKEDYYIFGNDFSIELLDNKKFYKAIKNCKNVELIKPIIIDFIKISFFCIETVLKTEENIYLFFKCIKLKHSSDFNFIWDVKKLSYDEKIEILYQVYLKYLNRGGVTDIFCSMFDFSIWWDEYESYKQINCAFMYSQIKSKVKKFLDIILGN